MASKWTDQQNTPIMVQIISADGKVTSVPLKSVMIDYVELLLDGVSDGEINKLINVTRTDAENWRYETGFKDYFDTRKRARGWSNVINNDFLSMLLGEAAIGKRELSATQINAIKLLMQAKGMLGVGNGFANKKKQSDEVQGFVIKEDGANGGQPGAK